MRELLVANLALTLWQPWADLVLTPDPIDPSRPVKPVENRGWPPPSTLPQWGTCPGHGRVVLDYGGNGHIADDGPDTVMGHDPRCGGECRYCPVPVQIDPRYACGPIEPDGPFPFRLWIHAAVKVDYSPAAEEAVRAFGESQLGPNPYASDAFVFVESIKCRVGVLLGSVTVTGCHEWTECEEVRPGQGLSLCSPWAQEPGDILRDLWHWTLADPVLLDEPIPMRGRQRLWTLPAGAVPA